MKVNVVCSRNIEKICEFAVVLVVVESRFDVVVVVEYSCCCCGGGSMLFSDVLHACRYVGMLMILFFTVVGQCCVFALLCLDSGSTLSYRSSFASSRNCLS